MLVLLMEEVNEVCISNALRRYYISNKFYDNHFKHLSNIMVITTI
jgi:hypothetical protein